MSIELEVLEPITVGSAEQLADLHESQLRWVCVSLVADGLEAAKFGVQSGVRDLVEFARASQPEGTTVTVWFQGRAEQFDFA